jgi:hypothetical protein
MPTARISLRRAGWVTKLPATYLKKIPMLVTRAEDHLQRSTQLSQRRVLGDQQPASDRRSLANVALYHEPRDFDIFGFDVTVLRNRRIGVNWKKDAQRLTF